jgi:hypothetical protein
LLRLLATKHDPGVISGSGSFLLPPSGGVYFSKGFFSMFGDHVFGAAECEPLPEFNDTPLTESETATAPSNNEAQI